MTLGTSIPILPARDLVETRAFYERLGFETRYWAPDPGEGYAILGRDALVVHFFAHPTLSLTDSYAGCYWRVTDVDALHRELEALDLPRAGAPRLGPIEDKPWRMREFALVDPSGNLVRVGHDLEARPGERATAGERVRRAITMLPIGWVRNSVTDPRDEDWGSVTSEIRVDPELADGLNELQHFSHAVVVFLMDEARFDRGAHLTRRPRGRADMPEVGIFAQRAKHRPNRIGITTVRIERVERGAIVVRGLDAIDGTPVLDVKPHIPAFDSPARPRVPEWVDRLMTGYF